MNTWGFVITAAMLQAEIMKASNGHNCRKRKIQGFYYTDKLLV